MRKYLTATIACAIVLSAGLAGAAELTVSQKKRQFKPNILNAKLGDTVVFMNDDRYPHNLSSKTPGFEFNVRKQMPGDKFAMKLDKRGRFQIDCVIHPRMKMTVNVE